MVHVDAMREFVRHDVAPHVWRREDKPPIVADRARGRTAAPARPGIADADRRVGDPCRRRQQPSLLDQPPPCLVAQPARDAITETLGRAAARQYPIGKVRRARRGSVPAQRNDNAVERNGRAVDERFGGLDPGELRLDPRRLTAGPFERGRAADPARHRQANQPARLVEHQPQAARARVDAKLDGPRQAGERERLTHRSRSTMWNSSSPASTSLIVQPRVDCPAAWTVSRLPEMR